MKAKCINNDENNTNFTVGKDYELYESGIRTDWAKMWTYFYDWNKPVCFDTGSKFNFARCTFQII